MSDDQSVPLMQRRPKSLWPVGVSTDSPNLKAQQRWRCKIANLKVRQRSKIAEIRSTLVKSGLVALDAQAATLGLSRSTTWTILNPSHKSSGLSAGTIIRIWRSPELPRLVRQRLMEYIEEKIAGLYGHTEKRRREFAECLMAALRNEFKLTVEPQESDRRRLSTRRPFPVSEVKSRRQKDRSSPGLPRQSV